MEFDLSMYSAPSESASRKLDRFVASQEMPYGYESSPPVDGHQNSEAKAAYKAQESHYKPSRKGK